MDRRKNAGRCMAVLGLSLVVGAALPAGASTKSAPDSSQEASREKKPTPTTDSTSAPARAPRNSQSTTSTTSKTPPSTVTVEPSSTTSTMAAPADLHSPTQVDAPARRTPTPPTPPGVVTSGPSSADANTSKTTETTTGSRNPHVVEDDKGKVPLPAFGEVAPTTTSTEVSNAVVGNIGQDKGPKPAQAPRRRQPARALGATGAATRPLLVMAGSTLLLGALAIAFGEPGPAQAAPATAGQATGTLPGRRRRPARRTPPGWESGVPLAPERRERARQRMQSRQSRPPVSRPGGARGA